MTAPDRPTSRYAWYVVAVLTLANVAGFVDRQILSLLVVPIERDLRITDVQMSYLIGLSFTVLYTLAGLPIARLADRANRRNIMAAGVGLWSLFTALCGVAQTYGRLALMRVGVGVGEASLAAPGISLLSDYFPRDRLGRAMSVYGLGIFLGSGLAYVIGGALVGVVAEQARWHWPIVGAIRPWQSAFVLVGAPGFLIAALFFTVREPRRGGQSRGAGGAESRPASIRALVDYVLANRRTFITISFGFALSATVNYGIAAWLATFLIRTYGWTAARAGLVQGVLTMTVGVVGVLSGGWATDALVRRGRADGALRVGIIGAAGMLVSASAYPLMPTAGLCVAWLVAVNFFAAFPWGAASAAVAQMTPPELRAQGAALYFVVLSLVSATLGPSAVAWIASLAFRDHNALGYALVVVNLAGMLGAGALLLAGLPAFRQTAGRGSTSD